MSPNGSCIQDLVLNSIFTGQVLKSDWGFDLINGLICWWVYNSRDLGAMETVGYWKNTICWGYAAQGCVLSWASCLFLFSVCHEVSGTICQMPLLRSYPLSPQLHGNVLAKTKSQNLSSFQLFIWGLLSQWWKVTNVRVVSFVALKFPRDNHGRMAEEEQETTRDRFLLLSSLFMELSVCVHKCACTNHTHGGSSALPSLLLNHRAPIRYCLSNPMSFLRSQFYAHQWLVIKVYFKKWNSPVLLSK